MTAPFDQWRLVEVEMELLHRRCAGLDIAKRGVTVCVRVAGSGRRRASETVTGWGSVTNQVLALRDHLVEQRVSCVVMEATGDYWKPFYYLFEGAGFEVILTNAKQVRNVPGRKSDVSDAAWLAQLAAHGLVRASFVPPVPIRQLRDLTRTRSSIVRERTREVQRLEKLLEDAGIKLSSVATNLTGVSSRAMLEALAAGERDPVVLADMARRRLRRRIPDLVEALIGRFNDHHAFLVRTHLDLIDSHTVAIDAVTARIEVMMEPFRQFRELIVSIPGISEGVADVIIAETGGDMTVFATGAHLASWAGTSPGSNESAGRVKSTKVRPGNSHLKGALGIAALAIARTKNTYLGTKYRRIAARRGGMRAVVAIERNLLEIIWTMAQTGAYYTDPGPEYYLRTNPTRAKSRAIKQLQALGYRVTLDAA